MNLQSKALLLFWIHGWIITWAFVSTASFCIALSDFQNHSSLLCSQKEKGGGCKVAIIDYPSHLMIWNSTKAYRPILKYWCIYNTGSSNCWTLYIYNTYLSTCLLILERAEERERNINVRETSTGCISYAPQLGTEPAA